MIITSEKQQEIKCSHCTHDKSPAGASLCEICGHPLTKQASAPSISRIPNLYRILVVISLGAFVAGGGLVTGLILQRTSDSPAKSVISTASDINLYSSLAEVPNVPTGTFYYGGALCFAAMQRNGMNRAIEKAHPGFELQYREPQEGKPGCSTGIQMLIGKQLSFAQNGRSLQKEENNAASELGFKLESVPVAIDGIVFYTHPDISIKFLTIEQLQGIYSGTITNWKEVGGPDLPIVPISQDPQSNSTLKLFMESESTVGENVEIARDYTTAMREVGSTSGAISYASAAIARGQETIKFVALAKDSDSPPVFALTPAGEVNLPAFKGSAYPLTRRLFVVIRRDGTLDEKAGVAYANLLLSIEGQKIIRDAGFVPLRSID